MKLIVIGNAILTIILIAVVMATHSPRTTEIVRARRLEIVDRTDRVRASLDVDEMGQPKFVLNTKEGRAALMVILDSKGHGTMFFDSPETVGKTSIGYLWGSDQVEADGEDPLASWGIRILRPNGASTGFGVREDDGHPIVNLAK